LDEEPMLSEAETSRYKRGSEPIKEDGQDIIPLERLLDILAQGQERINAGFEQISAAALSEEIQIGQNTVTRAARLHGQYFHDTYHTGQTDLLRQIAGKNDKVIG
jgi:hypothetical protein